MKLYSSQMSPFGARVTIALEAKGLKWDDAGLPDPSAPDGGLRSPDFLSLNPIGKVPVLVLSHGEALVESETILDFIDQSWPYPPLSPADPLARAQMRTPIRICENYICPPMFRLFPQLSAAPRDEELVAAERARLVAGLGYLAHFLEGHVYAFGDRLTLADCVVFPTLFLARVVGQALGWEDPVAEHPAVAAYYERGRHDPLLASAEARLAAAIAGARQ